MKKLTPKPIVDNPNPPVEIKGLKTIGNEFIEWAEQYWQIDKLIRFENIDVSDDPICNYEYMRDIFIRKIDGMVKERLGLSEF